ncbi:MAG: hypothetical protein ABRQ27_17205, partial [Clostridiaceae bacterium]
ELTQHALAYLGQESVTMDNAGNVNACILDYLRQYKYADGQWVTLYGALSGFIEYMNTNCLDFNAKIFEYIGPTCGLVTFNNHEIDLPHLAATALGYTNTETIVNLLVPNFWTGWGGDVATAMADITNYKNGTTGNGQYINMDVDFIAENYVIGSDTSSCSESDIDVDIDAIYFSNRFSIEGFDAIFEYYYNNVTGVMRKNLILVDDLGVENTVTESELSNEIVSKMEGLSGFSYPLEGDKLLAKATTQTGIAPTDDIKLAACHAFAKYILNHYA